MSNSGYVDWETFRRSHPHLGAFSVSKKSILLTYLAQENVEMSSSGQNYGQNYDQMSFSRQNYNEKLRSEKAIL